MTGSLEPRSLDFGFSLGCRGSMYSSLTSSGTAHLKGRRKSSFRRSLLAGEVGIDPRLLTSSNASRSSSIILEKSEMPIDSQKQGDPYQNLSDLTLPPRE